jgi:hypothetical protein
MSRVLDADARRAMADFLAVAAKAIARNTGDDASAWSAAIPLPAISRSRASARRIPEGRIAGLVVGDVRS